MATFTLTIGCADAATIYQVTTDTASVCLKFVKQHDHEGASARLFITDDESWYDGVFDDADVYPALEEWAAKERTTHGWGV